MSGRKHQYKKRKQETELYYKKRVIMLFENERFDAVRILCCYSIYAHIFFGNGSRMQIYSNGFFIMLK